MGPLGPVVIMSWYALSGVLMRLASPDFANMATTEQKLEAEYRACHTSVVNHSEEIAFYRYMFSLTPDLTSFQKSFTYPFFFLEGMFMNLEFFKERFSALFPT